MSKIHFYSFITKVWLLSLTKIRIFIKPTNNARNLDSCLPLSICLRTHIQNSFYNEPTLSTLSLPKFDP